MEDAQNYEETMEVKKLIQAVIFDLGRVPAGDSWAAGRGRIHGMKRWVLNRWSQRQICIRKCC